MPRESLGPMPDILREFIPKYLWVEMEHPEGYTVSHEHWNETWNLIRTQGDYNTNILKALIEWIGWMGEHSRFIYTSKDEPSDTFGQDGDLWIQYQD